jgi:exopolyphosphatase/guanosine-5'-triphosphate,3'-diphosphate pyrophosphatase
MNDSSGTMRLAGVDIGTLTCRLLIADLPRSLSDVDLSTAANDPRPSASFSARKNPQRIPANTPPVFPGLRPRIWPQLLRLVTNGNVGQAPSGRLIEVRSERRILRLGEGVDQTKQLSAAAMDRVLQCLREWREMIDASHVDAAAAVATSAVRDAENRDQFLDRVKHEVGFDVELISGEEEARRTMLGIRSGLPVGVTDVLALDIGGGSTEFILDRPSQKPIVRSIDIGVVRLCERLLHHDPPTDEEVRQAHEWVARETKTAVAEMANYQTATFVGTAGTITSLAAMAQKLPTYEPARIHNYMLKLDTIRELEQTLLSRKKADRIGLPGLEKGREEVIAAGAIIIRTVMETLGVDDCLVSDLGLREGMLIDLAIKISDGR